MFHASINSFNGDNTDLERIFEKNIKYIGMYKKHQKRLQQTILTLSMNDIPETNNNFEF